MAPAAWPLLVGLLSPVDTRELHHLEPAFGRCQCAARLRFAAGAPGRPPGLWSPQAAVGSAVQRSAWNDSSHLVVSPVVLGPTLSA